MNWSAAFVSAVLALASSAALAPRAALALPAESSNAIIVFGGGWGAEGTQASIESHVVSLVKAFEDREPRVLFASGDPTIRDVQIPAAAGDETSNLLGLVFDRRDHLQVGYRSAKVPHATLASKLQFLEALRATAKRSSTVVFGVGHGSPATESESAAIELWGPDDGITVEELAKHLDATPRSGPIAFVLGHCHSGAFADVIYKEGKAQNAIASPARCVFAAVPRDRQAAGCTPDVGDPDARAYMALIAEAFAKPGVADLDQNGKTSLAEAHAYARIHDRTVDVPVATSDVFLEKVFGNRRPQLNRVKLDKLLLKARATERRVVEELLQTRATSAGEAYKELVKELEVLRASEASAATEIDQLQDEWDAVRRALVDAVLMRFPELANVYHPQSRAWLADGAAEVVTFIKKRPELETLLARDGQILEQEDRRFALERRRARLERAMGALEIIANEDTLRRSTNSKAKATFERLLACEATEP